MSRPSAGCGSPADSSRNLGRRRRAAGHAGGLDVITGIRGSLRDNRGACLQLAGLACTADLDLGGSARGNLDHAAIGRRQLDSGAIHQLDRADPSSPTSSQGLPAGLAAGPAGLSQPVAGRRAPPVLLLAGVCLASRTPPAKPVETRIRAPRIRKVLAGAAVGSWAQLPRRRPKRFLGFIEAHVSHFFRMSSGKGWLRSARSSCWRPTSGTASGEGPAEGAGPGWTTAPIVVARARLSAQRRAPALSE